MIDFMYEGDIDLYEMALKIGSEPAIKDDGTPLLKDDKPILKAEKILRAWATSDNQDLQKRFVDLMLSEDNAFSKGMKETFFYVGLLSTCSNETRQRLLNDWKKKTGFSNSEELQKALREGEELGIKDREHKKAIQLEKQSEI